jgi:hypothetical protein
MTKAVLKVQDTPRGREPVLTYREETPEEQAQQADDLTKYQALRQGIDAEKTRIGSFYNNPNIEEYRNVMRTGDAAAIVAFIRSKINADGVTDLPSAIACFKRIETGLAFTNAMLARIAHRLLDPDSGPPPAPPTS